MSDPTRRCVFRVQTWRDTAVLAASNDECCCGSSGPAIPAERYPEPDWEDKINMLQSSFTQGSIIVPQNILTQNNMKYLK